MMFRTLMRVISRGADRLMAFIDVGPAPNPTRPNGHLDGKIFDKPKTLAVGNAFSRLYDACAKLLNQYPGLLAAVGVSFIMSSVLLLQVFSSDTMSITTRFGRIIHSWGVPTSFLPVIFQNRVSILTRSIIQRTLVTLSDNRHFWSFSSDVLTARSTSKRVLARQ